MTCHRFGVGLRLTATGVLLPFLRLHPPIASLTRDTLPAALSDREFWSLTEQLSEPNGYFRSNSGSPDNGRSGSAINYASLMSATDAATGAERGYLAIEENFAFVKTLQNKNLIVPIVGDFAGPKALRAVGAFLKDRGATVTAFYVSNVEMYLQRNGVWAAFCANVAAMPLDAASTFIRPGAGRSSTFGAMAAEIAGCPAR